MRLLLTTDDGVESEGFAALVEAVRGLPDAEAVTVAPAGPCSGIGHACTTHAPLPIQRVTGGGYAVQGTPVDCVRLGVLELLTGVDAVIAGINRGGNLGADTYTSGTVAAAREAVLLGLPAVALSQYVRRDIPVEWARSARLARRMLADLLARPARPGWFWNVNLPMPDPDDHTEPPVVHCGLDTGPLAVRYEIESPGANGDRTAHYTGDYHARPRQPGRDVDICFGGAIAITAIPLEIAAGDDPREHPDRD